MQTVDLNCDMGESFGRWKLGQDDEVMASITSANVACGFHAGDPNVMAATVALARRHGVAVGAHPGFADLEGFGRRVFRLSDSELRNLVLYQLGALWAFLKAEGLEMHHVKPHGALYNQACAVAEIARAVVEGAWQFSRELPIYCLPSSKLAEEAASKGIPAVPEGFADRAYEPNGSLAERSKPGAVANDPSAAAARAVQLADGSVTCVDGSILPLTVRTICVHGDTPGAPQIAAAVRAKLAESGFVATATLHG